MSREIDVLTELDAAGFLVVEEATNQTWGAEELSRARGDARLQAADRLAAAGRQEEVSGPFPGCMQMAGGVNEYASCSLVGRTRHFLIFDRPG